MQPNQTLHFLGTIAELLDEVKEMGKGHWIKEATATTPLEIDLSREPQPSFRILRHNLYDSRSGQNKEHRRRVPQPQERVPQPPKAIGVIRPVQRGNEVELRVYLETDPKTQLYDKVHERWGELYAHLETRGRLVAKTDSPEQNTEPKGSQLDILTSARDEASKLSAAIMREIGVDPELADKHFEHEANFLNLLARQEREKREEELRKLNALETIANAINQQIIIESPVKVEQAPEQQKAVERGMKAGTAERVTEFHRLVKSGMSQRQAKKRSQCDPDTYYRWCVKVTGEGPIQPYR